MVVDVLMPIITEEGEEAVVTAWLVDEGARVHKGQLIAEAQGEKVAVDIEAPADGIVRGLVAINEGVPQGQTICRIEEPGEATGASESVEPAQPEAEPHRAGSAPRASPAARRLAREMGVDLAAIEGTGPQGRITEADVRRAGEATDEQAGMTGLRAVIARNMRESHGATAPVTLTTVADVTDTVPSQITVWVLRSAAAALRAHPALDGTRDGDTFQPAATTAISLAIQTDEGLVAPVVRDPLSRSFEELDGEVRALAERARSRQLTSQDYEGGTFTVTNLGSYGIDAFTPIINLPQIAILGVGAIRTVPGLDGDEVVPRQQMTLSLTFDHAFVDGAPAAEFLAEVRAQLEKGNAE